MNIFINIISGQLKWRMLKGRKAAIREIRFSHHYWGQTDYQLPSIRCFCESTPTSYTTRSASLLLNFIFIEVSGAPVRTPWKLNLSSPLSHASSTIFTYIDVVHVSSTILIFSYINPQSCEQYYIDIYIYWCRTCKQYYIDIYIYWCRQPFHDPYSWKEKAMHLISDILNTVTLNNIYR